MEIKEKLLSDLKDAAKAKDSLKLNTLRLLNSEIKNKEIDLRRELEPDEVLSIVSSQLKKRKEAISMYEKGDRLDLRDQEQQESEILKAFLPEQVSEEEVRKRAGEAIRETGAEGPGDMGKVMKILVPEFKGRAEGTLIKDVVNSLLKQ